jgi:hypothetical protein
VSGARFPAKLNNPDTVIGFRGAMFASAPAAAACPADAAGWAALAAGGGLTITSAPGPYEFSPLQLVPEVLYANIFKVPLNITRFAVNVTLGPSGAPPTGAPAGAAGLPVAAAVADGYVFSNSSVTGGPQLNPFVGVPPYSGAAEGRFTEADADGGRWVLLTLPNLTFSFNSKTSGQFKGDGTLDFSFSGPLVLRAPLGCGRDCGPHGRCKAGAGNGTTPACECECGWGVSPRTGACTEPLGYCSIYGGGVTFAAAGPVGTAGALLAARAGGGGGMAVSGASCPSGYGYNVRAQTCDPCASGFGGPGCRTCSSDAACVSKTGKAAATCASGLTFAERSSEKHYSCALSDPSIATVVGPVLAFSCNTANPDGQAASTVSRSSAVAGAAGGGWACSSRGRHWKRGAPKQGRPSTGHTHLSRGCLHPQSFTHCIADAPRPRPLRDSPHPPALPGPTPAQLTPGPWWATPPPAASSCASATCRPTRPPSAPRGAATLARATRAGSATPSSASAPTAAPRTGRTTGRPSRT